MPTYEYACDLCGHQVDIFQSINAEKLVNCPACLKDGLKRLIGKGGGVIFKGTGFYQTDYKNTTQPTESSAKEGASKSAAPASGEASASKPAATPVSATPSTSNSSS